MSENRTIVPTLLRAGLNELFNLPNGITSAITEIGIGTAHYTPTDDMTAAQGELFRIPVLDSTIPAAGQAMFYAEISDWTGELTPCYEIIFYLASGTPLAIYSSNNVELVLLEGSPNDLYYTLALDALPAEKIEIISTEIVFYQAEAVKELRSAFINPVYGSSRKPITLYGDGGVDAPAGVRWLAMGQSDPTENVVYTTSVGQWTVSREFAIDGGIVPGALISDINRGTASYSAAYIAVFNGEYEAGVTALSYARLDSSEALSAVMFGATGDGVTDDQSAFDALELSESGIAVDLLGLEYVVDSIPANNRYYNGSFIVDGVSRAVKKTPASHPLDGDAVAMIGGGRQHWWGFSLLHRPDSNKTYVFASPASGHAGNYGSPLQLFTSLDRMQTLDGGRTIYCPGDRLISDITTGNASSDVMIGFMHTRDKTTNAVRNDTIRSIDFGDTWEFSADVLSGNNPLFPYGPMLHETGVSYIFGYGGNEIRWAKTADFGVTYTTGVAIPFDGTNWQAEASVVKAADSQYLMFIRSENTTMAVSKSSHLEGPWSAPVDTGIQLDSNPVYAIVEAGRLYVYMYSRSFGGAILDAHNTVQLLDLNASEFFSSLDINKGFKTVRNLPVRGVAYPNAVKIGNEWLWLFNAGETDISTNSTSSSAVFIGRTDSVISASTHYAEQASKRGNILSNATFNHWTRGNSFNSFNSIKKVADAWIVNPSGSTVSVEKVELQPATSRMFPHNPAFGMSLVATADDYINIYQRQYGRDALVPALNSVINATVWGIGEIPDTVSFGISVNFGTGGSASGISTSALKVKSAPGGVWCATATIPPVTSFEPNISDDCYVDFSFSSAKNENWDCVIVGVQFESSEAFSVIESVPFDEERGILDARIQMLEYESYDEIGACVALTETHARTPIQFKKMRKSPTASFLSGGASELEHYALGITPTTVSLEGIGRSGLSVRTDVSSGLTAGQSTVLRCKNGGSIKLLLDAE